jgi:hypothetical protein
MMSLRRFVGATVLVVVVSSGLARAQEPRVPFRSFARFALDPENASGLWLEVVAALVHDEATAPGAYVGQASADVITAGPRVAYGGRYGEVGLLIPFRSVDLEASTPFGNQKIDENGIGDLELYGRWTPLRTEWVDAGLGLDLGLPTGDEGKGLGTGKLGLLPFGTAALHLGIADLRAHFGYLTYPDGDEIFGEKIPPDAFIYGGGVWVALGSHIALRAEILGESFDTRLSGDAVSFQPGVDLSWPLGDVDILVRPTGAVGITGDATDWGIGGSLAAMWH